MRNSETVDAIVALVDVDLDPGVCGPQLELQGVFAWRKWRERADSRAVFADRYSFNATVVRSIATSMFPHHWPYIGS